MAPSGPAGSLVRSTVAQPRVFIGLTLCLVLGARCLVAQDTQAPVFKGGVDMLSVAVTVVDRDGHPIPDLTAQDFTIKVEGQHLPVRTLDFMQFGTAGGSSATGPGRVTSNTDHSVSARRGGRIIVVLNDDLSNRPGDGTDVRIAVERFLPSLDPDDLVGLTSTSGYGPVVSPTRNRQAILAALGSPKSVGRYDDLTNPFYVSMLEAMAFARRMPSDPTMNAVIGRECGAGGGRGTTCPDRLSSMAKALAVWTIHRADMQIAAYRDVIEALRVAPQPRVLVALTHGIALPQEMHPEQALEIISHAAADADVRFYALVNFIDSVDIRDVGNPGMPPYDRRSARQEEGSYLLDGMKSIASQSGGEAFSVIGQADRFLKRIEAETSGLYQLGVPLPASVASHQYLNVQVSVDRPHVTVHAVPHALTPGSAPKPASVEETMRMRLGQGGVAFGVPITLGTALRRDPEGARVQLGVDVELPGTVDGPLTTMFAVIDAMGKTAQSGRTTISQKPTPEDYRLSWGIPLADGSYRLRVVVADAHGNVGSVERAVAAHLNRFGTVATSDLLTAWVAPDHPPQFLALDLLPAAAATLRCALELYPDQVANSGSLGVRFRLEHTDDPLHPVVVTEREEAPAPLNGVLTAVAMLPAGPLVPGSYAIHATIVSGGQDIGVVSGAFRKTPQ